jgi:DNA-binding MarR family transcriptional regulator
MRSHRDIQLSNRHNQTKLIILRELAHPHRWLTSGDIAKLCNLTVNNTSRQLTKLVRQGYIWRRDIGRKSYRYRHLKPMGNRVLRKLWIRDKLTRETNDSGIDLNLEHSIPLDYVGLEHQIEEKFNLWLFSGTES